MCFANETVQYCQMLKTCKYAALTSPLYIDILTNLSLVCLHFCSIYCIAKFNILHWKEKKLKHSFKTHWKRALIVQLYHQINYFLFAMENVSYITSQQILSLYFSFIVFLYETLAAESGKQTIYQELSVDSVVTSLSLVRLPLSYQKTN